ncbi:HlyD family secretion protein [Pandoraea sp. CB10b_02]|uniref:HlyD family secretion protein n=1 Tax=Pandoraea sp. CB10b_02 TaxID=2014535 RepID=UPI00257FFC26|nr:HlyD family secretion protein [Pandoraea sp. CB10b_02]
MSTVALPSRLRFASRKTWMVAAGVALSVAAIAAAGHWWLVGRFIESTDDAYVRADVTRVSPRIAGYVSRVEVDDNQHVRVGDVLVRLDDRDARAGVLHAKATVQSAAADVQVQIDAAATLDAEWVRQRSLIAQAQADVDGAQAQYARHTADAQRYRALLGDGAASRQRFEQAEAQALQASASLVHAKAASQAQCEQLTVLQRRREQSKATIAQANARLAAAQAALTQAELTLSHTVVRAASDGVVGQRSVRVGQYVEAGDPLLALVPLADVYVIANFKETQVRRMRQGQPVSVDIDAYPEHSLRGTVSSFSPGSGAQFALLPPDNATGNFTKIVQRIPVKIRIDHAPDRGPVLRPGMSVIAQVDTRNRRDGNDGGDGGDGREGAREASQ